MSILNIPEELKYKPKAPIKPLNLTTKDVIEYFGPRQMFGVFRQFEGIRFDSGKLEFTGTPDQNHYPEQFDPVIKIVDMQHDFTLKLSEVGSLNMSLRDPYKECLRILLEEWGY